ncbi:WD40 repeat and Utp12 domain-containing protein [Aspergillus clavatus NRRL 1]|uniref:Small nucleolar ribonucleoprotein complex component (Utp5), putative n=1 Tax=Aspergillus clavatus (strain ATCC 1007 / CBS 513.65 / DSM 816 / NCTC 3887 / NRRL 1 / QM 1276 / 107) TaxID=344612 RepID=A1CHZ8_ASPCL|nr:small nucleolar ribonucleoprotein complex component (Utp5), putative [Aspergillus clavatus NRRL 1]EAW10503.1 small nucleolar ribonucleoprotein complex component (Utp5), putative [Aspergillus clavatus NRRL 1]
MGKKASRPPVSKTSSAASPAVSSQTYAGNKSSILKASFAPSEYQLALFASVIQGLDAQHLRIHDINTGRLQCEHVLGPKETVTSLDWGFYLGKQRDRDQQSKKKRKRNSDVNGTAEGLEQGDIVVAFGTSVSDIRMYSPAEDKVVATLEGGHDKGIRDFKFTANRPGQEGWSIGSDNKLVQWDLCSGKAIRTIHLPSTGYSTLSRPVSSNPPVICASQAPHIIDIEEDESTVSFPAMRNQIREIITSSTASIDSGLFLASDGDRYINVFDVQGRKLVMNLVTDTEVSSLALCTSLGQQAGEIPELEKQVLAAVTEDGTIELFPRPFVLSKDQSVKASLKAKGRQLTRRAESSIKITQSETSDTSAAVVAAAFQGSDLIIACAEGGIVPVFERVTCINADTEELAFTGLRKVAKTKSSSALASVTTNGARTASETHVDESRTVVEQGDLAETDVEMQDTRDDAVPAADTEGEDSEDEDVAKKPTDKKALQQQKSKKDADSDVDMRSDGGDEEDEDEDETGEPSFGELLRAHASEEVDVEAELEDDVRIGSLVPGKPNAAVQQITSGVTLSTVLSQSLKTNDNAMLESCFHTGDLTIIRETIQRLDSSLAATLLQKLAERLSSRPGRYGHLLVWVQWTCVAHGGALAGKPELLKRMSTLFKVMDQRSSSLSSLLLLKGKLDMLHAQLGLRQSLRGGADGMDSEDEENIIYVEGQEEFEDEDSDADTAKHAVTPRTKSIRDQTYDEDDSMIDGEQSGRDEDDDEEDEGSEEEDNDEDVFDVEAEESVGSSDAEESLEEDGDEDDEDAESVGSMADFIADTEDEASEDGGLSAQPPPSKKAKFSGGGKGKKAGKR